MKAQHVLTDDMISLSQEMFLRDHHWVAYNSHSYELGERDLSFFRNKQEAKGFTQNEGNESYSLIYASSIMDLISQLS